MAEPVNRLARIEIDLNARTSDNLVPAWREDADGDMAPGDSVTVFESESNVAAPAQVVRVDGDLICLRVAWNELADDRKKATIFTGMHLGRSWAGHDIEDACPCKQAPCGLVISDDVHPDCTQHLIDKSIRQRHRAQECPGEAEAECTASIHGACLALSQSETPCDIENQECVYGGRPAREERAAP